MNFQEIVTLLQATFGEDIIRKIDDKALQPSITIDETRLLEICSFLHTNTKLYFDFLACITAIDNGVEKDTLEIIYNLTSIPYEHNLMLKIIFPRNTADGKLPKISSVSSIWKTADWHERETYDLMGIDFVGHPDLRRILLPTDWVGHPLRKDYVPQETYHGIKIKSE